MPHCWAFLHHHFIEILVKIYICCFYLSHYSAYRGLYILNWIYRYFTEPHYVHWISMTLSLSLSLFYTGTHTCRCMHTQMPHIHILNYACQDLIHEVILLLQLGYQGLFKHCFMLISSIIISTGHNYFSQ